MLRNSRLVQAQCNQYMRLQSLYGHCDGHNTDGHNTELSGVIAKISNVTIPTFHATPCDNLPPAEPRKSEAGMSSEDMDLM